MYTQCPECDTRFRVTAAELSAANGEVCCGNCNTEFNALIGLTDEVPVIHIDGHRGDGVLDSTSNGNDRDKVLDPISNDDDRDKVLDPISNDDDRDKVLDISAINDDRDEILDISGINDDRDEIPGQNIDDHRRDEVLDRKVNDQSEMPIIEVPETRADLTGSLLDADEAEDLYADTAGTDFLLGETNENFADITGADITGLDITGPDIPIFQLDENDAGGLDEDLPIQLTGNFELSELTREFLPPADHDTGDPLIVESEAGFEEEIAREDAGESDHAESAEDDIDDDTDDRTRASDAGAATGFGGGIPSGEKGGPMPPWLATSAESERRGSVVAEPLSPRLMAAALALTILFAGQLLHYNRDALAAHPRFGGIVRGFYAGLGADVYPAWRLSSFEVRGTEAITAGGPAPALHILAKVLVVGRQTVGMPLIRVVLRDRWSDPVASGVFSPTEYLAENRDVPDTLAPGTTLPVRISVADPGTDARGYVVDVCLPERASGLQCQLAKNPFR